MRNLIYIKRGYGFTLVELLIVVSLIGILAGVTVSVLNPQRQRMTAEDGVRRANLDKMITGIEAFNSAEGRYPNNKAELCPSTYVTACPDNSPTTGTTYDYSFSGGNYGVIVNKASGGCLKYRSDTAWGGKISDCTACSITNNNCSGSSYTYSQCGLPSYSLISTSTCNTWLLNGTAKRWGSACTSPGSHASCVPVGCAQVADPCAATGTPPTNMTYRWDCVCQ